MKNKTNKKKGKKKFDEMFGSFEIDIGWFVDYFAEEDMEKLKKFKNKFGLD